MGQNENSKRAASVLIIAQHKFKQALKKEDTEARSPPISVELSAQFLSDLDAVLKQNTPVNVQKCTAWIVKHVAISRARITSLGDYLISISKSIVPDQLLAASAPVKTALKTASRARFVLLLIVNDVLHTDKYHQRSTAKGGFFSKDSMSYLPELIELAASYISDKESQAEKKLRAILNYWAINQLISADDFRALQHQADEALLIAQGGMPVRKRNYLLPEYHGDRNAPWHELPASYMLEQMIENRDRPIDARRIKPVRLDRKPVSAHVRKLLDNYFENIDLKYVPTGDNPTGETKKHKLSLDPMGQLVKCDKETGETNTVCNGYGWSMKLCQDMQKDGIPESIRQAREEAQREAEMETLRPAPQQRRNDHRASPSPRRRRSPSSSSEYRRERGGRSHSRHSSRSSYDSHQDSRSKGRDRSRSRHPMSPRHERTKSDDRGRAYENRVPSRNNGRDASSSGQQWIGPNGPLRNPPGPATNNQYPPPPHNVAQGFSQSPQLPFSAPPFPIQPPMPQMPGQFPNHPFPPPPPPPPFQPGAFPGGVPPPPPPNYSGPFPPPPPNMAAMPNNPYNFGGNQHGNGNQYGNNAYGDGFGYGQNQGNFQGGQNQGSFQGGQIQGSFQGGQNQSNFQGGRGGFRGNFQGGGNNNRGGYGGQQRGQRGGRR